MSKMTAVDDDDLDEIEVRVGSVTEEVVVDPESDRFHADISELKSLDGVSPNLKRKVSRELEKVHRGRDNAGSKKVEYQDIAMTGYNLFDVVLPPYNLDYLAKLTELSSPHYAAIKAKVSNIVGLGFDFVETRKTKDKLDGITGEEETMRARKKLSKGKGDLLDWLDSCNEDDEFIETLIKIWTDYESTGNAYMEIGRTNTGQIGYLGHIPATTMRIRKGRDGFVQIAADKVVFFNNFGDKTTTSPISGSGRNNEVIHLKKYSPVQNYYGVPDIISAQQAVAGNEFSSRFNLDYFENKAVPRYVVIIKGGKLSKNSERHILEFFQTNLKGKNHRTLYVPLPADEDGKKAEFKMEPVEAGTQDSSFNNYRKGNLNEILMSHGVPISKVGMAEGVSLAVARDADKTFKEQICKPQQRILEKKLNKIIKEVTDVFEIKLNELTLTDEDTQSKIDERYLRWGVIVPNEVRARTGKTGIKDGDKPVGMMQQAALANDAKAEAKSAAGQNRTRDAERSANSPDSSGEARQPKGEGRVTN